MRKSWAVVVLLAVMGIALPAKAQEDAAKLEAYAGYDYIRLNINANVSSFPPSESFNANGGGGQLVFNANNWLGVVGDLSGYGVTDTSSPRVSAFLGASDAGRVLPDENPRRPQQSAK